MVHALLEILRRRYLILQALALVLWLVLDIAGYGFGFIDALLRRPMTNADAGGISTLFGNSPPAGPVRLSRNDRTALQQRLRTKFGETPPKHVQLADLKSMYSLKQRSLCDWRGSNVAADPKECNQLANATPLFRALLSAMHPKTEVLMLEQLRGYRGDPIAIAFFVGRAGRPQILFDLSRVNTNHWATAKGFQLKAYHGKGLTDLPLGKELSVGHGLFLIDDPGHLERRRGMCGTPTCPAEFLLYGIDHQNLRDTAGKPVTQNLVDIAITGDIEKRFDLFSALLDASIALPAPLPAQPYQVERFAVTKFNTVHLGRKIDAIFGPGASARVLYSPVGYRVAFGSVFGISLDGQLFTLWDGGTGYASLGTDRFVFDILERGKSRRLGDVKSQAGLYALPYSGFPADGKMTLEVRKLTAQADAPWSTFESFTDLFGPLRNAPR